MKLRCKHIIYSIICVVIVFLSNFFIPSLSNGFTKGLNTSLNRLWINENAEEVFHARYSISEYRRRPFVLEFQNFTNKKLDIPYQFSFNLINYFSLFLIFLSLPKLQFSLTKNRNHSLFYKFLFLSSMPIVFAFYSSMSTYDDLLQYLFLILFLTNLFNNRHIIAALFFTIACICRETSLIYYFIIAAFFLIEKFDNKQKKAFLWILPGILYVIFITQYLPSELLVESKEFMLHRRFLAWTKNFDSITSFKESITIISIMIGVYTYFLINLYKSRTSKRDKKWYLTSIVFIIINLTIVSLTGLIREARLLFIPILISLPFIASEIRLSLHKLWQRKLSFKREMTIFLGAFLIAFVFFTPNTSGTGYLYKTYAFFYFFVWFELITQNRLLKTIHRPNDTKTNESSQPVTEFSNDSTDN